MGIDIVVSEKIIRHWLLKGKASGCTHMIVVCDTWEYEDFPIYVSEDEDVREVEAKYDDDNHMLRVMEVYSFNHDIEAQLRETRAFHYD